ncbi:hypothetical protein CPLU01_09835 [Colletotrichum plurivorum]|uniref:Uncharacterized protein n=1 Tax=Colletotrichum plurivorum TaxID=2175906 RepID=A0A8H6K827_9PEZI|nr:hypothetical protein CPLU01_09835 [Colletotrichum plurivorum]
MAFSANEPFFQMIGSPSAPHERPPLAQTDKYSDQHLMPYGQDKAHLHQSTIDLQPNHLSDCPAREKCPFAKSHGYLPGSVTWPSLVAQPKSFPISLADDLPTLSTQTSQASGAPVDSAPPSTTRINVPGREIKIPADDSEMILIRVPPEHATAEKLQQIRDCAELIFKDAKAYKLPHANRNTTTE